MPKTESASTAKPQTSIPGMPFDFSPLVNSNQHGMKAAAEAQEHLLTRMTKVNGELFRFFSQRLDHDRKTVQELSTCKSPQDAFGVWSAFMEKAATQYAEEMAALAGLYADQAREAMDNVSHEVDEIVKTSQNGGG